MSGRTEAAGREKKMKIEVKELLEELRIDTDCERCPRCEDGNCKGHLQWLCRKIKAVAERSEE